MDPTIKDYHRHLFRYTGGATINSFVSLSWSCDDDEGVKPTSYRCELCNVTANGGKGRIEQHCNTADHKFHKDRIRKMQCSSTHAVACATLQLRMEDSAFLETWRKPIHCILYWILLYDDEPNTYHSLDRACELYNAYEEMDRIALLELAAWKAICIARCTPEKHDVLSLQCWIQRGWKVTKYEWYKSNGIRQIVSGVIPFLDCTTTSLVNERYPKIAAFQKPLNNTIPNNRKRPQDDLSDDDLSEDDLSHCSGTTSTMYRCYVCSGPDQNGKSVKEHLSSTKHKDNMRCSLLRRMHQRSYYGQECIKLQLRIDALGLDDWQMSVQCILYWILLYQCEPRTEFTLTKAEQLLLKFEHMERISLLELAAWKAMCIANTHETRCDIYLSWEWIQKGWKTKKGELRHHNGMNVILSSVLPYLGTYNSQ